MSLSTDPAFSYVKDNFICGYKDISRKRYAGASGKHKPDGNAIHTTNGAGPHNIQIFVLAPDGTVLHCLPGYWCAEDLVTELQFADELWQLWKGDLPEAQKHNQFKKLHMQHIRAHSDEMKERSHLQHFDIHYEAERVARSDVFWNPRQVAKNSHHVDQRLVKTADVIAHQRMVSRPFLQYSEFDVAAFSDYGDPMYDKHEDSLDERGRRTGAPIKESYIGNDPRARPIQTAVKKKGKRVLMQALRTGISAAIKN